MGIALFEKYCVEVFFPWKQRIAFIETNSTLPALAGEHPTAP